MQKRGVSAKRAGARARGAGMRMHHVPERSGQYMYCHQKLRIRKRFETGGVKTLPTRRQTDRQTDRHLLLLIIVRLLLLLLLQVLRAVRSRELLLFFSIRVRVQVSGAVRTREQRRRIFAVLRIVLKNTSTRTDSAPAPRIRTHD